MDTFCLVHGAWHDDACWELLVAELARRGHECLTPVLPAEDPDATFDDYAAIVLDCLGGREHALLIGHSMASAVIPLVAPRVPVKLLVYLCPAMSGFAPPADQPLYQRAAWVRPPIDAEGRSWWPWERAITQFYGRLDSQLAERLARHLRPQPQAPFSAPHPLGGLSADTLNIPAQASDTDPPPHTSPPDPGGPQLARSRCSATICADPRYPRAPHRRGSTPSGESGRRLRGRRTALTRRASLPILASLLLRLALRNCSPD